MRKTEVNIQIEDINLPTKDDSEISVETPSLHVVIRVGGITVDVGNIAVSKSDAERLIHMTLSAFEMHRQMRMDRES